MVQQKRRYFSQRQLSKRFQVSVSTIQRYLQTGTHAAKDALVPTDPKIFIAAI